MATLQYSITFHGDWHCGSGMAAGAELDALVIKDGRGLPYIPGKTIKGLLREQAEMLVSHIYQERELQFITCMGNRVTIDNEDKIPDEMGTLFFSNATFNEQTALEIENKQLLPLLFHTIASTRIDENGVAEDHSLRSVQVVVPCTLYGQIANIPAELLPIIEQGLKLIKHLGTHRHRGLGRCEFNIIK